MADCAAYSRRWPLPSTPTGRWTRRPPASSPASCSRTARTGWSSRARPASRPRSTTPSTSALLRAVVDEVGGEAPIVCGTGTNDTRHTIALTKAAADAGAEAALVVTPYYNKPNPAGVRAHFEAVAAAVPGLPLIVYNIPSRVIVNISPGELAELAKIDNVVAVKQANNDELESIEGMAVLAGNDDVFLRTLELGGAGGITVASHLVGPRMREIWDAAQAGDLDRARRIDATIRPVYEALGVTTNPMPVKAALEMLGTIPCGAMRLPMVELDEVQREVVREALGSVGLSPTGG